MNTKKTLETIKNKIPNIIIFIVECSILTQEQTNYLINNSNYFLNLYKDVDLRNKIYGISKSLGEGIMTIEALKMIRDTNILYTNLIKISGRYWLTDKFNYNLFENNNIVIKKINNNINNIFTAIYKIPINIVNLLLIFLSNNIKMMEECIGYEVLFSKFIKQLTNENIKFIDIFGLEGYVAVDNYINNW